MSDLNAVLGEVIAAQRHRLGMSQEQLGFACDLHRTYISQIERGIKSPTVGALFDIAAALETKPSELLRRVERKL